MKRCQSFLSLFFGNSLKFGKYVMRRKKGDSLNLCCHGIAMVVERENLHGKSVEHDEKSKQIWYKMKWKNYFRWKINADIVDLFQFLPIVTTANCSCFSHSQEKNQRREKIIRGSNAIRFKLNWVKTKAWSRYIRIFYKFYLKKKHSDP